MKKLLILGLGLTITFSIYAAEYCPNGTHLTKEGEDISFQIKAYNSPEIIRKLKYFDTEIAKLQNKNSSNLQYYIDKANSQYNQHKQLLDQWKDAQVGRATRYGLISGGPLVSIEEKYNLGIKELQEVRDNQINEFNRLFPDKYTEKGKLMKQALLDQYPEVFNCSCDSGSSINGICRKDAQTQNLKLNKNNSTIRKFMRKRTHTGRKSYRNRRNRLSTVRTRVRPMDKFRTRRVLRKRSSLFSRRNILRSRRNKLNSQ